MLDFQNMYRAYRRAVSKVEFEDDGHAIAWAMAH